jgi:hypothetical protein
MHSRLGWCSIARSVDQFILKRCVVCGCVCKLKSAARHWLACLGGRREPACVSATASSEGEGEGFVDLRGRSKEVSQSGRRLAHTTHLVDHQSMDETLWVFVYGRRCMDLSCGVVCRCVPCPGCCLSESACFRLFGGAAWSAPLPNRRHHDEIIIPSRATSDTSTQAAARHALGPNVWACMQLA